MSQFTLLPTIRRSLDLVYRPPWMPNPLIIDGSTVGSVHSFPRASDVTNGFAFASPNHPSDPGRTYFKADQDVVLINFVNFDLRIYGGRNVRIIGPKLTPTAHDQTVFFFENTFKSIFIEGAHIDAVGFSVDCMANRWFSAVATDAGLTGVTAMPEMIVQTMLIENLRDQESPLGAHTDGWQRQGSIDWVRFENVTIEGGQQAIYPMSSGVGPSMGMDIRKTNVRRWRSADGTSYTRAYYLAEGGASQTNTNYAITLDQVWAERNLAAFTATSRSVYPIVPEKTWGGVEFSDHIGTYVDFATSTITAEGIIRIGVPPNGDFVSAAEVGIGYISPWGAP